MTKISFTVTGTDTDYFGDYPFDLVYLDVTLTFADDSTKTYKIVGTLDVGEYQDFGHIQDSDEGLDLMSELDDDDNEFSDDEKTALFDAIKENCRGSYWYVKKYTTGSYYKSRAGYACVEVEVTTAQWNTSNETVYNLIAYLDDDDCVKIGGEDGSDGYYYVRKDIEDSDMKEELSTLLSDFEAE